MERDNDTFKNLRTIPHNKHTDDFGKDYCPVLFGIIFSLTSAIISILCGGLVAEVNSIAYRLFFALRKWGFLLQPGTLPLIVLVVFFSKNYIFSVLLCVFTVF